MISMCSLHVCLAYRGQSRQPTTDADKVLYQAGLGEKEIEFQSLDLSQLEFRELLYTHFPAEGRWWISASERSPKQLWCGTFINGCSHAPLQAC